MTPIGVDIGGTSVKVAVGTSTATSDSYRNPDAATLGAAVGQALERAGASGRGRVCVCLPGVIEGGVVRDSIHLPRLVGARVEAFVPAGDVVRIETDVRAAAHHVWRETGVAGRLLAIAMGTGVGMCVLDDGSPLRVTGESSGHLGQVDVGDVALEAVVGAEALRDAGEAIDGEVISLSADPLNALARGIRTVQAIYRPEHVVLLGGIGIRLALAPLRERVEACLTRLARPGWVLSQGWTGFHAALGGVMLIGDQT